MHVRSSNGDDRSPNSHYDADIHYAFQLCHWILRPIGVYPFVYSNASKLERILSVPLLIICCSIILFVIVPLHYIMFYVKDINARIKFLGPLVFCATTLIKYIYLCLNGSAFERCVRHVEGDWRMLEDQDHRGIMIEHITMGRKLIAACATLLYTGGVSYTIMPLLSTVKTENITVRPVTYPGYEAFFDIQRSPNYEIVFCMHGMYVMVTANITMGVYSMATIFTSHACGQMKVQIARLENLTKKKIAEKRREEDRLSVVVRDHAEILRFTKDVEEALRDICLIEVVVSTMLICLVAYYCMMEWETSDSVAILTYMMLLISFVFNILMFCYLGELLLDEGNKVASASYETKWYDLPAKKARDIVLLLAISKHPPKLTAGKIFDLSVNTFGVVRGPVLKSSVVYLNVLQTITEF